MVMDTSNALNYGDSQEPKYERGKLYPVSVRLNGETMRLLDDMLEQLHYDSYDDAIRDMVEQSHDMLL